MAPRELPKTTPKTQRVIAKPSTMKKPSLPNNNSASTTKKTNPVKNTIISTPSRETRLRTNTVPAIATPKPRDNRSVPLPGSVTKTAKKSWKRRPKPAHSGVPVPEKMKRLLTKQLQDCKF